MPQDWPDFSARLGRVLAELAPGERSVILIIMDSAEPGCMVQYICGGDGGGTWAEVASNKSLPKHRRLSKDDEQRLRSTGWDKPSGGRWSPVRLPNWSTDRFSDPEADHGVLADMSVTALRDVLRIASPAGLMYDAFDQETGEPVTLGALGVAREPR
ncbi:hypothetical protein E1281_21440 [Actinomadura sp. KC345]|uniref:TY-Chap domain-containing protein n=1 Tax=Actinomadura sp. KC345 TaxID=2530371 RepID=UPI0010470694|nr:hypothetical protein [Actinomadura sp. KC345]TDC50793.1 hypothetical protein E1281_21440 [Actinomadura sp. KC345]